MSPKLFIITTLSLLLWSCGDKPKSKTNNFSIETNATNNSITLGDELNLDIKNPNNLSISSVIYKLDTKTIDSKFDSKDAKLGVRNLTATVISSEGTEDLSTTVTILNNEAPMVYTYKIINTYPHDITSYTQGLEFFNDTLYESTGQYGSSKLRKVDYKTGKVIKNIDLAPQYFGEGLTILNDKIYQLTWRENIGLVYDVNTLEKISSFNYGQSKEGWGLCNDGKMIYKSDGTDKIWTLNPDSLMEESEIQVFTPSGRVNGINEMEWVDGKIYANIYQRNGVAIINPKNGAMEGVIDFSPLHKLVTQHPKLDVLNGIAYNPKTNTLFVTGKDWDKLFEVEIIEIKK